MKLAIRFALSVLAFATAPLAAAPPEPAKPLFASDETIHITIRGPIDILARGGPDSRNVVPGTIAVNGTQDVLPIQLALRGITRRQREVCQFPPLRVVFTTAPPAGSLFAGQRKLKLVTHCRPVESFQNYLLLEAATYRLYNQLTPMSFRARVAQVDYMTAAGAPITSRIGFFLEDIDDVGRRNGMREAKVGERIAVAQLSPPDAARVGLFEYMVGNLDWAMQAGPPGDACCHNSPLIGPTGATSATLYPVPYDWDFSGMVDTPYAVPPDSVPVRNVRQRRYRGFCRHNAEALVEIGRLRSMQSALMANYTAIPGLDPKAAAKATAYLASFFADIATDASAQTKLLKTCL